MQPSDIHYDVALSYAGEDRGYARALATALRSRGVSVFYDEELKAALWGKNLYDYLSDLYQNRATYVVVFLSRHYTKAWTNLERRAMQARALQAQEEYILPIRIDDTSAEGILPTVAYLDWPPENADSVANTLTKKLRERPSIPGHTRWGAPEPARILIGHKDEVLDLAYSADGS